MMRILGIKLKTIRAERYIEPDDKPRQIRIDHNSQVTRLVNTQDNNLTIEFEYKADYGPIGKIFLEGTLLCDDDDAKRIAKEWQDTRKMPDQFASTVHTAVMHACVPEAVGIAKDLGLPPPIPLPQVKLNTTTTKPGQQGGMEVA